MKAVSEPTQEDTSGAISNEAPGLAATEAAGQIPSDFCTSGASAEAKALYQAVLRQMLTLAEAFAKSGADDKFWELYVRAERMLKTAMRIVEFELKERKLNLQAETSNARQTAAAAASPVKHPEQPAIASAQRSASGVAPNGIPKTDSKSNSSTTPRNAWAGNCPDGASSKQPVAESIAEILSAPALETISESVRRYNLDKAVVPLCKTPRLAPR